MNNELTRIEETLLKVSFEDATAIANEAFDIEVEADGIEELIFVLTRKVVRGARSDSELAKSKQAIEKLSEAQGLLMEVALLRCEAARDRDVEEEAEWRLQDSV